MSMIHQDIWTILVGLLEDSPRALARTARVCRAANYAVTSRLPEIISGWARVVVRSYPLCSFPLYSRVFDNSVHNAIGYDLEKICIFKWGNIVITLLRSKDAVSVELRIVPYRITRARIELASGHVKNVHDRSSSDIAESLARFAVWLFPGIYGDVVLKVVPNNMRILIPHIMMCNSCEWSRK